MFHRGSDPSAKRPLAHGRGSDSRLPPVHRFLLLGLERRVKPTLPRNPKSGVIPSSYGACAASIDRNGGRSRKLIGTDSASYNRHYDWRLGARSRAWFRCFAASSMVAVRWKVRGGLD